MVSLLLAGGLTVAMGAGFFVGGTAGMVLAAILLVIALAHLAFAHLAFFDERKRKWGKMGALAWLALASGYLLTTGGLVLLLTKLMDENESELVADAGEGEQDDEGRDVPVSFVTNVASGGETARLGQVGRGEGEDASKGGAHEDNQNAMNAQQVFDPDIAGAEGGEGDVTHVSAQNVPDALEEGVADEGPADAVGDALARVGEDDETVAQGVNFADLTFTEDDEVLAFSDALIKDVENEPEIERRGQDRVESNVRVRQNTLGVAVPKAMSGRCDKLGRISRLNRAFVNDPAGVERAVVKALDWLTANQNDDGSWGTTSRGAMTGFALLCYLGHCELTDSVVYGEAVQKGIKFLVELGDRKNGWLYTTNNRHGAAYAQGIATYALAESYAMTEQDFIFPVLKKSVVRIIKGQKQDGGWYYLEQVKGLDGNRYDDFGKNEKAASDTSVSGWQFQALKAAFNTGQFGDALDPAITASVKNFYRVYSPKNGGFGYRKASDAVNVKHKLTGVGALGLQSWKGGHPSLEKKKQTLKKAIQHILKNNPTMSYSSKDANLYSWYYDTQAIFNYGGIAWKAWNRKLEPMLLSAQKKDGSWPAEGSGLTSRRSGKDAEVYRTTLCTLMLEVYYRYVY